MSGIDNFDKQEWDNSMTICPICGKEFMVLCKSDYVYKTKDNKGKLFYYCSYSYFNKGKEVIKCNKTYKSKYYV